MGDFSRSDRIGAEMQRELALLLRLSVKDQRLSNVTIQEVRVTRDLSYAKVYYTHMGQGLDKKLYKALAGAAGYFRKKLSGSMQLRTIPQLQFVYDKSIEDGLRLSALIEKANADNRQED